MKMQRKAAIIERVFAEHGVDCLVLPPELRQKKPCV